MVSTSLKESLFSLPAVLPGKLLKLLLVFLILNIRRWKMSPVSYTGMGDTEILKQILYAIDPSIDEFKTEVEEEAEE